MTAIRSSEWPRITIVMPSFNQARFLPSAIESVLDQRYPNLEMFVLDGGSSDDSESIIRSYESELAFWRSEQDEGQAAAVNEGWSRATGDILGWLNSDDLYAEGALGAVADAYLEQPNIKLLWGDCSVANERGRVLSTKHPWNHDLKRILLGSTLPQPATFGTKSLIETVGLLDSSQIYAFDWAFFLRVFLKVPQPQLRYIPKTLAISREYSNTKSRTAGSLKTIERRATLQKVFDDPDLPIEIMRHRNLAISRTYWLQLLLELRLNAWIPAAGSFVHAVGSAPMSIFGVLIPVIRIAYSIVNENVRGRR